MTATVEIERAEIPRSSPTQVLFSLLLGPWTTPDLGTTWSGWAVTLQIDGAAIAQRRFLRRGAADRLQRRIEAQLPTADAVALARRYKMYQALPAETPRVGLPLTEGPAGATSSRDAPRTASRSPAARNSKPNNGQVVRGLRLFTSRASRPHDDRTRSVFGSSTVCTVLTVSDARSGERVAQHQFDNDRSTLKAKMNFIAAAEALSEDAYQTADWQRVLDKAALAPWKGPASRNKGT